MSKQELRQAASEGSGVSYEESTLASQMVPTLYDRIGDDGILRLTQRFYDKVFEDDEAWFINIFSSSTKSEAIDNQVSEWRIRCRFRCCWCFRVTNNP